MNVVKYTNVTTKDEETGESKAQEVKLAGATFKLSTDKAGENVMKFHALSESIYEVCANADCTERTDWLDELSQIKNVAIWSRKFFCELKPL